MRGGRREEGDNEKEGTRQPRLHHARLYYIFLRVSTPPTAFLLPPLQILSPSLTRSFAPPSPSPFPLLVCVFQPSLVPSIIHLLSASTSITHSPLYKQFPVLPFSPPFPPSTPLTLLSFPSLPNYPSLVPFHFSLSLSHTLPFPHFPSPPYLTLPSYYPPHFFPHSSFHPLSFLPLNASPLLILTLPPPLPFPFNLPFSLTLPFPHSLFPSPLYSSSLSHTLPLPQSPSLIPLTFPQSFTLPLPHSPLHPLLPFPFTLPPDRQGSTLTCIITLR